MSPQLPCLNLAVVTKSGLSLGRVVDVEVDTTAREVRYYHVEPPLSLAKLWRQRLLISPSQVISITPEVMTVDDITPEQAVRPAPGLASQSS